MYITNPRSRNLYTEYFALVAVMMRFSKGIFNGRISGDGLNLLTVYNIQHIYATANCCCYPKSIITNKKKVNGKWLRKLKSTEKWRA